MSAKKEDKENKYGFKLGDRVIVKGKHAGIVKFVGPLDQELSRAPIYVGVQLYDNVSSLHNGLFRGKRYFHCPPGHAAMVKIGKVTKVSTDSAKKSLPKQGNAMFPSYQEIKARRQERSAMDPEFDLGPPYGSSRPKSSTVNISDQEDMAVKDAQKEDQRQKKKSAKLITKQEDADSKQGSSEREIQQWKKKFGNNDRGERMARTLNKLFVAYEKGLQLRQEEEQEAAAAAAAAAKAELDTETESEGWSERGDWG